MVNVKDNVHTVLVSVVNYLMNTSHPLGIDVVVCVKVLEPCCRDTDCIEALCLDSLEECLVSLRAAPAGLCLKTGALNGDISFGIVRIGLLSISVEGITQIPAHLHVFCDLKCCHCLVRSVSNKTDRCDAK